jgi:WD40 repeat protein
MSNPFICHFKNCNIFFEKAVFLPCSNSICEFHISVLLENGVKKLECNLCDAFHDIPAHGFPMNKALNKVIEENLHLTNKQKEAKKLSEKYLTSKLDYIKLDAKQIVSKRFETIQKNIVSHKEHLSNKIDKEYNETITKLNENKEKILSIIENRSTECNLNDEEIKSSIVKLRSPNLSENEIKEIESILKIGIAELEMKIINFEEELFLNNNIEFTPKDISFINLFEEKNESSEDGDETDVAENNNYFTVENVRTFNGHSNLIRKCIVFENLRILLSASDDDLVRVWNLDTAECIQILNEHKNSVTCLNKIPGKSYRVITGSSDKSMHIWSYSHEINKFEFIKIIVEKSHIVRQSFISDSSLINGLLNGMISVWSINQNTLETKNILTFEAHNKAVACLTANEMYLITSSNDGQIRIWSSKTYDLERELVDAHKKRILALELFKDRNQLISGSDDKSIKIWNIINGECIKEFNPNMIVYSIKFISNNHFVAGGYGRTANFLMFDSNQAIQKISGHKHTVFHVELLENGYFLSTSNDKTIKLWKII